MKKILLTLFVLFSVFTVNVRPQEVIELYNGTVTNSTNITQYVNLVSDRSFRIDSIQVQLLCKGEIDIDALSIMKGTNTTATGFVGIASVDSTVLTVDNADGIYTAYKYTASETGLNDLRGIDKIRVRVYPASSGNDATDPNKLRIRIFKYMTKMRY